LEKEVTGSLLKKYLSDRIFQMNEVTYHYEYSVSIIFLNLYFNNLHTVYDNFNNKKYLHVKVTVNQITVKKTGFKIFGMKRSFLKETKIIENFLKCLHISVDTPVKS
jgi:hypothetical protein